MSEASAEELARGVAGGDRAALARAITLVESTRDDHQAIGQEVLSRLVAGIEPSVRVGITGVPGAGKSTFIEALGLHLVASGRKVAVLAVDPSSTLSGGSILGDKTRMQELARSPHAFIRPSPTAGTLGGVARRTREAILLCEAAGYHTVIVETVGTGQSEAAVADMVDCFCLLVLAGAGDELQGIKRGVLELADILLVNKADGDNVSRANLAAAQYRSTLRHLRSPSPGWTPPVLCISSLPGTGDMETVWETIVDHERTQAESGQRERRRAGQRLRWMWDQVEDHLREAVRTHPAVAAILQQTREDVEAGRTSPSAAARRILTAFGSPSKEDPS